MSGPVFESGNRSLALASLYAHTRAHLALMLVSGCRVVDAEGLLVNVGPAPPLLMCTGDTRGSAGSGRLYAVGECRCWIYALLRRMEKADTRQAYV